MIKNIVIFDLDGTTIDSSHRQATKSDGTLDLAHWFDNATPEKIFADKLLPLAQQMHKRCKAGDYVIVCTARAMQFADFELSHNYSHLTFLDKVYFLQHQHKLMKTWVVDK